MHDKSILIVGGNAAATVLEGRETELIEIVRGAYLAHAAGKTCVPESSFLRIPDNAKNRIIALPAYLCGTAARAGLKWIASFPENVAHNMDRASGVLILNSPSTGIPEAILEASVISAKRTAASAALAAMSLVGSHPYQCLGLVGCGYINHEICRFVLKVSPEIQKIVMYDTDDSVAHRVTPAYRKMAGRAQVQCADTLAEVLRACDLISFASTAAQPYLMHLEGCAPGCTILHISLRDLGCEAILSADNLVDDPDHVCRADTSIHLTEQQTGNRAFIRGTLADVLTGRIVARSHAESRTVFSPFGLGMLDLAVGDLVLLYARQKGFTTNIPSFLPDPWRLSLSSQL